MGYKHVNELVMNVIKTEIRVAATLKTMNEIKSGVKKFKQRKLSWNLISLIFKFTIQTSNNLRKFPSI